MQNNKRLLNELILMHRERNRGEKGRERDTNVKGEKGWREIKREGEG